MGYTKVQNELLERRDLGAVEKLILIWLYGRGRQDGQPWEVNSDQIRKALHLGHDATDAALSKLKAKGWLTDNRQPVRGDDGQFQHNSSYVIESRRSDVVMPDMPGFTQSGFPRRGFPDDNKGPSTKDGLTSTSNDPWAEEPSASLPTAPAITDIRPDPSPLKAPTNPAGSSSSSLNSSTNPSYSPVDLVSAAGSERATASERQEEAEDHSSDAEFWAEDWAKSGQDWPLCDVCHKRHGPWISCASPKYDPYAKARAADRKREERRNAA